jgi:hypothetical protein
MSLVTAGNVNRQNQSCERILRIISRNSKFFFQTFARIYSKNMHSVATKPEATIKLLIPAGDDMRYF